MESSIKMTDYPLEGPIKDSKGLTTSEALKRLHDDIKEVLDHEKMKGNFWKLCKASLQLWTPLCTFHWITLSILIVEVITLIVAQCTHYSIMSQTLMCEAVFLVLITGLNLAFALWDTKLRMNEMQTRAQLILQFLDEWQEKCDWKPENYPNIHSPLSPSITLQATFRDGNIVNLPWALLVKGDTIILRPGQSAPGRCRNLRVGDKGGPNFSLEMDEIYAPLVEEVHNTSFSQSGEQFSTPQVRDPLPCVYCILEETPYVHSVRTVLQEALNRPTSVLHKEKYLCFTVCLEQFAAPAFLIVILVVNAIRYFYSSSWLGSGHWTDMFLIQPCSVILPLLPLVLPAVWLFINAYGVALILALFYTARNIKNKISNDPFEDAEMASPTHSSFWSKMRLVRPYFLDTLFGRSKSPFRTENLFQVFSSVTALCCIDKKGILSWPNPTAEKVFFLRSAQPPTDTSPGSGGGSSSSADLKPKLAGAILKKDKRFIRRRLRKRSCHHHKHPTQYHQETTVTEVLDLSHDCTTPFRLQFDDPSWYQYIGSLKPLGLAVLLNTCNPATQEKYSQFCAHLGCLGLFHEDLVPVTNRRDGELARADPSPVESARMTTIINNVVARGCLCELAKQIGFQNAARNIFSLKDQLFTFRHQADLARKDRLARSLSLPKLKFPFPNIVSVCVQDSTNGRHQLLSQGTGEILLDACVDYWNGEDICPLTLSDRKRILDFYNRSSLTAYCTAFAYRPLNTRLQSIGTGMGDKLFNSSGVYLELPADSSHLYEPQRSPTPAANLSLTRIHSDGNLYYSTATAADTANQQYQPSRSNESLLIGDSPDDVNPESPEGIFQLQCNQIFVGMVTMQYQARTDMVQLIEQLDKASVRFVHFSKENELRSRVFSEKMGLESGWNCHISLLSDSAADNKEANGESGGKRRHKSVISLAGKDIGKEENLGTSTVIKNNNPFLAPLEHCRPLSVSAPSAINVEMAQVKFEDEISLHSLTDESDSNSDLPKDDERERLFHSPKSPVSMKTPSPQRHHLVNCPSHDSSLDSCSTNSSSSSSSVLINVAGGGSSCWDVNVSLTRSQSHVTESTEQSAPVAFDLSNRAKLPRGIEEIRPHIENVDNVPLLVSLFTECTPTATREMIKIMQEYGEVVCIVGSSASAYNSAIFMQADASLAVEPLYPQVCQQVPVSVPVTETNVISPIELSRRLNSLPCALSFHRDELSSLLHLVLESRHVGLCLRNALQLWASSVASLSVLQIITAILFLPPIMTAGQIIWISCITIPILSVSLLGAPTDPAVMNIATGKNSRNVDRATLSFVTWNYGFKFLPSLILLVAIFGTTLMSLCTEVEGLDCTDAPTCSWVYPARNGTVASGSWSGWGDAASWHSLYTIQHCTAMAFVVYLVFISMSFIHRQHHFWKVSPLNNQLWILSSALVIVLQIVYFVTAVAMFQPNPASLPEPCRSTPPISLLDGPLPIWTLVVWPIPLVALNELVKHYEIKMNVRLQKRARLEFGTKLGMNSPF